MAAAGEAATHRDGLPRTMASYGYTALSALAHLQGGETTERVRAAIRDTRADTKEALRDLKADETMTRRALELISSRRSDRYEAELEALREYKLEVLAQTRCISTRSWGGCCRCWCD